MKKERIAVFAIETNKETSAMDIENLTTLMNVLSRQYNFKWCRTINSKWVRALADEMEEREKEIN